MIKKIKTDSPIHIFKVAEGILPTEYTDEGIPFYQNTLIKSNIFQQALSKAAGP